MIRFECCGFIGSSRKTWRGYISKLVYSGDSMEISIVLAQPVTAWVCKSSSGYFVYFACYEQGVNLDSLFLVDENASRMAAIFDDKDAFTVAFAIVKVGELLSKPRRKYNQKKKTPAFADLPF